ncbi:hypothetical protein Bealeia1_00702 [Candidatus Bealeia paramacronuclearis]|uniref:Secreted protein n=1 Tax=Candidatus Bealeia paramacronuclearis TaxID=1921001 RepID=A0ABZ2C4C7_9PROT|nr:hypothetical protein [Candidatus Bealeia paramacronuclearis]
MRVIFSILSLILLFGSENTIAVPHPTGNADHLKNNGNAKIARDCPGSAQVSCFKNLDQSNQTYYGSLQSSWSKTDNFPLCWDTDVGIFGKCEPCQYKHSGKSSDQIMQDLTNLCNSSAGCYVDGKAVKCCNKHNPTDCCNGDCVANL